MEQKTEDIRRAKDLLEGRIRIGAPDEGAGRRVQDLWDHVAKPLDGFGELEKRTVQIGAIQGGMPDLSRPCAVVIAADNGIVREGVSQSGPEITALCAENIAAGKSTLGPLAGRTGTKIAVYDFGILNGPCPGVSDWCIRRGTRDFLEEPAMTKEEALLAIGQGMRIAKEKKEAGYTILTAGEMGIGNTTTSAAVLSALLHLPPEETAGRGAGLSDAGLQRKQEVIGRALSRYETDLSDPLPVLSDLGGFDIAGMTGLILGGALQGIPVILDGIISQTAALLASRLVPEVLPYLVPSHKSRQPAGERILSELHLHPVLDAGLAVGEGTGALLFLEVLQAAVEVLQEGSDFAGYGMEAYTRPDA